MSAPQFTPGPWSIYQRREDDGRAMQIDDANGGRVASINFWSDDYEANARLIAAAPELYEALDGLLNESADTSLTPPMMLNAGLSATFVKAVERALAAIAKVRSE